MRKYNIASKSDMRRMVRDMNRTIENEFQKQLRKPIDYVCPNCGKRIRISAGSNRCSGCGYSIRLDITA